MDEQDFAEAYLELNRRIFNLLDSFSALSALSSLDLRRTDEPTMLRKALQGLAENLDIRSCSIFMRQDDKLVNCTGIDWEDVIREENDLPLSQHAPPLTISAGEGIMGLAFQEKTLQHCRDCHSDPRFKAFPGQEIGSLISTPIFQAGGEVLGVLNISHSEPNFFNEWHERFLVMYCHCLGQLLINSRLINHMESEIEKRTRQLKRALEETRSAQQGLSLFKSIIESLREAVCISAPEQGLIYVNPAFEKLFHRTLAEARLLEANTRRNCEASGTPADFPVPGATGNENREEELEMVDALGRRFPIRTITDTVRDADGNILFTFSFIQDISEHRKAEEEKKRLEAQLYQSQKMDAIGQLAGGVAHDFNNIITAIIGYAHVLLMKMDPSTPLRPFAEQILASSERAANVTRGLLAFSRKQVFNPEPVDLNRVIEKMDQLLSRLIGEDIEIETRLAPVELVVMADSCQLEQILMNLATNARDAMINGGKLTIATTLDEISDDFIRDHGYGIPGSYVRVSVSDTGIGMDAALVQKIFEPFFTTKEVGRGTGLGLAIVYGLVKQLRGYITVSSELNKGTTFTIHIPVLETKAAEEAGHKPLLLPADKRTILIAEDDRDMRTIGSTLLTEYGYRVLTAVDGQDAIDTFTNGKDLIDLVILDLVMPKKNGKEVYDSIRRIRPDVKVLFTSGYSKEIINKKGGVVEELQFLRKPHTPVELLKKVRTILEAA